ncbi:NAD(P)/FAD-dependent oxidoreductase [Nocardioides sp.]|uniref:phytoene desaturase family protein n=1 Tax=Nocardioides sp. TaxID=35761 RepID=UPI00286C5E11|nr:NAD(P)/FAD-dependent oxidoreductase [Nocardioides sp.]
MPTAIVVGSGPNGLAAAVTLAKAGVGVTVLEAHDTIGGGTRTSELTVPGLLHDHCSAVHPMGVASPFMRGADLTSYGVTWRYPDVDLAHPLDGGRAGVMVQDLEETRALLGADGDAWARLFGPIADAFDDLAEDLMGPILHVPHHPVHLARFGLRALLPASTVARRWKTDEARALYAGAAAHAFFPLHRPTSSAIGTMLLAVGHRFGWPVPEGGSARITDALAAIVVEHGGRIETGVRVRSLDDLPPTDVVILDLAPAGVVEVAGDRLPRRVRRAYERYRHGPGAFKLDLAVQGGIPWTNEHARRAGTVHLGGRFEEIAEAEVDIQRGRMPARPYVLLSQQYVADPTRSVGDLHPVWAYAHVPTGYDGDASEAIIAQIERFAPGVRDRIVAQVTTTTSAWEDYNPNYVGGDIVTGANDERQVLFRPRLALDPYATGIPGVFICSAATPPGAGVHGMGGANAAASALQHLR